MAGRCTVILASLGGDLARAHADDVAGALAAKSPEEVDLQRLVVERLDDSVLSGRADVAVHRIEHLPARMPEDLALAAILPRRWSTDALVSAFPLKGLPRGARVATSDVRRRAMLLRARPDLKVQETHADVRERVATWRVGDCDALLLSTESLKRLAVEAPCEELDPKAFVPSAGQGAVGCVCRRGSRSEEVLAGIDDPRTRTEVDIERAVLQRLGGWPDAPVGVQAAAHGTRVSVRAVVLSLDGRRAVTLAQDLSAKEALYEADEFVERLQGMGAEILLEKARNALR